VSTIELNISYNSVLFKFELRIRKCQIDFWKTKLPNYEIVLIPYKKDVRRFAAQIKDQAK